jgi:D-amino-acid dehydrogenase
MKVVVVGGGIVGMFVSYYLLKSGCTVAIVDRDPDVGGASTYNAGLVVPSSTATPPIGSWRMIKSVSGVSHPITISLGQIIRNIPFFQRALKGGLGAADKLVMDLSKKSLGLYLDFLKAESLDVDLVTEVLVVFARFSDAEAHSRIFGGDLVESDQLQQWGYSGFGGAVLHKDEIALNPGKLVRCLRSRLLEMGSALLKGRSAHVVVEGKRTVGVEVDGEKVQGDAYVVAAGSWSRQLCQPLNYDPPLLPARGFVMLFDTKGSVVQKPALLEDYGAVFSQHRQNVLRVTSFFEMVGFNESFSRGRMEWLLDICRKHLPRSQDMKLFETGCGFRPCTSDQLPIVGPIAGYDNAFIATGHCRLGLTLAPVTGYALNSMINGKPSEIDVTGLSPSRFS